MGVALIIWDPSRSAPLPLFLVAVVLARAFAAPRLESYRRSVLVPLVPLAALFYESVGLDAWTVITGVAVFLMAAALLSGLRARVGRTGRGQSNTYEAPACQEVKSSPERKR